MRVLIVDDIEMARRILREVLEKEGIQVYEATNGEEAVFMYEQTHPDVITLDLAMPDKEDSGLEVLKEIRSKDADVKILVITGETTVKNFVDSVSNGANVFMLKPINLEKLIKIIKED